VARGPVFDSRLSVGHVTAALAVYPVVAAPLVDAVTRVETSLGQVLIAARGAGREVPPLRALQLVLDRVAPDLEEQFRLAVRRLEAEAGALPRPALVALRDAQALLREIIVGRRPLDCLATVARTVASELVSLSARAGRARLEAPFLQGTHARVLGDVLVTGRGLLASTLVVRGRLEVLADHATVRGGTIELDGTAELRALHPGTGTAPVVLRRPGARLLVACVELGVVVASPSGLRRFDEATADVELDATGPLRPGRRPA
jgi:hypothetical protein